MNKLLIFLKVILAILFVGCLFNMSYGFYQLIRFLGMIGFGTFAFYVYKINKIWFLIWLASALLINPIFKIALGRELWNVIDIVWAILLIVSIFVNREIKKSK